MIRKNKWGIVLRNGSPVYFKNKKAALSAAKILGANPIHKMKISNGKWFFARISNLNL